MPAGSTFMVLMLVLGRWTSVEEDPPAPTHAVISEPSAERDEERRVGSDAAIGHWEIDDWDLKT